MKKTSLRRSLAWVSLFFGSVWMHSGMAYDLPSINLGLTSYLDGVLAAGTGLYYQNYLEYFTAARFNDARGARLPLRMTVLAAPYCNLTTESATFSLHRST